jgi:hypothetical protein
LRGGSLINSGGGGGLEGGDDTGDGGGVSSLIMILFISSSFLAFALALDFGGIFIYNTILDFFSAHERNHEDILGCTREMSARIDYIYNILYQKGPSCDINSSNKKFDVCLCLL